MSRFKEGDPVWVKGEFRYTDDDGDPVVAFRGYDDSRVDVALAEAQAIPRTDDAPKATSPVHVVKLEATRRTVRTPENDGGLYSEESEDNEITLVTAAGHRIDLAPWVVDALRMELAR